MRLAEIKKPSLERLWFKCPHCNKNIAIYDNTAVCGGVYVKCSKCRREIEIKIGGKQEN